MKTLKVSKMTPQYDVIVFEPGDNQEIGGCLVGYVTTTLSALLNNFGEPTFRSFDEDDKVTTEWELEIEGTRIRIYDWKRYELGQPGLTEDYEWHIGGDDYQAVKKLKQLLIDINLADVAATVISRDYDYKFEIARTDGML